MKRFSLFIFYLLLFAFIHSCNSSSNEGYFKVKTILNGNTIILNNEMKIKLAGITNTNNSFRYLEENTLGRVMKIRLDNKLNVKRNSKFRKLYYGYLVNRNNDCINSEILKRGIANLIVDYNYDSLDIYKTYTNQTNNTNIYKRPVKINNNNLILDVASIVKSTEKSIFVVYAKNKIDNTGKQGTGFFIKDENIGITNYHVISNSKELYIKTFDNQYYKISKIIKESKKFDYAIFKVKSNIKFPNLKISKILPQQGEDIVVIGNPQGLENTVTKGLISAIRTKYVTNDLIQVDAAISHGSSGSPVLNMFGEVIGIATMKQQDCESCNFAYNISVIEY